MLGPGGGAGAGGPGGGGLMAWGLPRVHSAVPGTPCFITWKRVAFKWELWRPPTVGRAGKRWQVYSTHTPWRRG